MINHNSHTCYISIKELADQYCTLLKNYIQIQPCVNADEFIFSHIKNKVNPEIAIFQECAVSIIRGIYASQFNFNDPSQYEDWIHLAFINITNIGIDYNFAQEYIHDLERSLIVLLDYSFPIFYSTQILVENSLVIDIRSNLDLIITLETRPQWQWPEDHEQN
jgi:hypothetical protein